ncbi:MAG TPA: glycosyltransferase [bacterium]|nr:glycosyltransferase [bacterium]
MSLVSVLIPVLNGERYLEACLRSVLAQTYPDFELIVVNDGSTDGTDRIVREILAAHPGKAIRYLVQENRGPCKSLNRAFAEAKGDYVCYLGADDLYLESFLHDAVAALSRSGPQVCSVFLDGYIIDGEGQRQCRWSDWGPRPWGSNQYRELLAGNWLPVAGLLHRASVLRELGPLDESTPNEDYHMWLRFARRYRFLAVPKLGFEYRIHGKNKSGNDAHVARTFLHLNRHHPEMKSYLNLAWALLEGEWGTAARLINFSNLDLVRRILQRRLQILLKRPPVTVDAARKKRILRILAGHYRHKVWATEAEPHS